MISDSEWKEYSCLYSLHHGVDMIEIANSVLITETYFSCEIKTHKY